MIDIIVELIFTPLFYLIEVIIDLLPVAFALPSWATNAVDLIGLGLRFFPSDVWLILMGNILFWINIQIGWAGIEWVYKKLPGVN